MTNRILVFYGSYRSDRMGIRLAQFVVERLRTPRRRCRADRRQGGRPADAGPDVQGISEGPGARGAGTLAGKIRGADGFVFVTGEYNWGIQPGLKNLTDHFLEEWFWRPAAIASYSAGRFAGARAATAWHGTLSEMGMVVISSARSRSGRSRRRCRRTASRPARAARRWNTRSRVLPMIWHGGWRRRRRSGRGSRRLIEGACVSLDQKKR